MRRAHDGMRGATAWPWLLLVASLALLAWFLLDRGPDAPEPDLDDVGPDATPAEMDHAFREADAVTIPAPPPADDHDAGPFAPIQRGPEPSPLLKRMLAEPGRYRRLLEAARRYFDLEQEQWKGRRTLVAALAKHAAAGERILATPDALRYVVAQGRSFLPPLSDRRWQRAQGITDAKPAPRGLYRIRDASLDLTLSVPRIMRGRKALERAYPRVDPAPLLIAMHDPGDARAKVPGVDLIERRYGDRRLWASVRDGWHLLVPHARGGSYLDEDGAPRPATFQMPLSVYWKHHHVDFDRFVLDGGREAFSVATGMPMFFAGIVLRGTWTLDARMAAQVINFADVPVYVVGNEPLAEALREAGHGSVTLGKADETLVQWMTDRRRVWPTTFAWRAARTDQVLAWWVNLDAPAWDAPGRCLDVAVGTTPGDRNTIRIRATGIDVLSLFLNDEIVDLDRPVRVEVNGHVEHAGTVTPLGPLPEGIDRDFDALFNREPLRIRNSMYFGWLTPARIVQLQVRAPSESTGTPGRATPGEEARAGGHASFAPCPALPPAGERLEARARGERSEGAVPAEAPPVVTGPVEFLESPDVPPAVDPGAPGLGAPQDAPSRFDWRWILAVGLAGLALILALRRR